jgi:hypothetical protein
MILKSYQVNTFTYALVKTSTGLSLQHDDPVLPIPHRLDILNLHQNALNLFASFEGDWYLVSDTGYMISELTHPFHTDPNIRKIGLSYDPLSAITASSDEMSMYAGQFRVVLSLSRDTNRIFRYQIFRYRESPWGSYWHESMPSFNPLVTMDIFVYNVLYPMYILNGVSYAQTRT